MNRTAALAVTAALVLGAAPAALAQPGPPDGVPVPAHARAAAAAGAEHSQEGRDRASENAGFPVPANEQAREDGRAFGLQRAEEASSQAGANGADNRQHGMEASQEGRDRASENAGFPVPADEQAREDGRAFGLEVGAAASGNGEVEAAATASGNGEVDAAASAEGEVATDDDGVDVDAQAETGSDLPEPAADALDLPALTELPELPDEADAARSALSALTDALQRVLDLVRGLFGPLGDGV